MTTNSMSLGDFLQNVENRRIRFRSPTTELSADQLSRIAKVFTVLGRFNTTTLEQWETNFMRDRHPDREIAIWEAIATRYMDWGRRNPKATPNEQFDFYGHCLICSMQQFPVVLKKA